MLIFILKKIRRLLCLIYLFINFNDVAVWSYEWL